MSLNGRTKNAFPFIFLYFPVYFVGCWLHPKPGDSKVQTKSQLEYVRVKAAALTCST